MRAGDPLPSTTVVGDGRTSVRLAVPNGGRILTYSDVTDLVEMPNLQRLATTDP